MVITGKYTEGDEFFFSGKLEKILIHAEIFENKREDFVFSKKPRKKSILGIETIPIICDRIVQIAKDSNPLHFEEITKLCNLYFLRVRREDYVIYFLLKHITLGTGDKEYADDDTKNSDNTIKIDVFPKEVSANKDDDKGDGEKWIGVTHFGFRENKKPEDYTNPVKEKSGEEERIRKKSQDSVPDVLMGSQSSGSSLPENLSDTVEYSGN